MNTYSFKHCFILYISLLIICLNLIGCAGRDYINQKNIDQTVLDYYNFKEGSYWVYEDSVGNTDSTWISAYSFIKWEYNPSHAIDYVEKLEYYINSSFQEKIYAKIQPSIDEKHIICDWVTQSASGSSLFSWSINHNQTGFYATDGKLIEYRNVLNVGGINYADVFILKSSNLADNDEIYMAKNVGIIHKKKGYSNFYLVRKHVLQ